MTTRRPLIYIDTDDPIHDLILHNDNGFIMKQDKYISKKDTLVKENYNENNPMKGVRWIEQKQYYRVILFNEDKIFSIRMNGSKSDARIAACEYSLTLIKNKYNVSLITEEIEQVERLHFSSPSKSFNVPLYSSVTHPIVCVDHILPHFNLKNPEQKLNS